jgi:ubiquinone/menaquinone biosynthesis C-methylase UbiE
MNETLLRYFNEVEKHHWWWEGRRQLLKNSIELNENLRILDIGCGTGETITFLNDILSNPEIIGVDNSLLALNFVKARRHQGVHCDAVNLPFISSSFDYILLLDIIEHIEKDSDVLEESKRVIKKKGKILITVPALPFLFSIHDSAQNHYRRYSRKQIRKLAEENNLKIIKLSYFNFCLSPLIIFLRLMSRLKVFSKLGDYDSDINYKIADKKIVNQLLKIVFVNEVKLIKKINYPLGISLFCILEKG